MMRKLWVAFVLVVLVRCAPGPPDAQRVLQRASENMGAANLRSIHYSGSGQVFGFGQSYSPNDPWPRFHLTRYSRAINYETPSSQEEVVRRQAEDPPRGGSFQPLIGERRQVEAVSGNYAWNLVQNIADPEAAFQPPSPTPSPALDEVTQRQLEIWLTPHGFLQAALNSTPTAQSQTVGNRTVTVVSFSFDKYRVNGTIGEQNLVEKVVTWMDSPWLGDMLVETTYSNYQDFGGVKFPMQITQRRGGHPTLELTVSEARPNMPVAIEVPESVRQVTAEPERVESQRLAAGVWLLEGGHNSVAIEFQDSVAVVEAPGDEERSLAVIAEVKRLLPDKPIRYLINTHHHVDHSGGIRTYVAEGATIVTHEINRAFYERLFQAPHTLAPDRLSQAPRPASFETVADKHVLSDGTRTLEIRHIQGNGHNGGLIMAYLPRERLLIEADAFSARPGTPLPAVPNVFTVNLYENIRRLGLRVDRVVPIHGRVVPLAELRKAVGEG